MKGKIEKETKLELDEQGYATLYGAGVVKRRVDQLNVYYDRSWVLADNKITLRVRFESGRRPQLTLKVPKRHSGRERVMAEYDVDVQQLPREHRSCAHRRIDVDEHLPRDFRNEISRLGLHALDRVGWMRNRRSHLFFDGVGELELDAVSLPDGRCFYEVEIESDDPETHVRLTSFVLSLAPTAKESKCSKFERFRRATACVEVNDGP